MVFVCSDGVCVSLFNLHCILKYSVRSEIGVLMLLCFLILCKFLKFLYANLIMLMTRFKNVAQYLTLVLHAINLGGVIDLNQQLFS